MALGRDYFRFQALKHGDRIFYAGGTAGQRPQWNPDPDRAREDFPLFVYCLQAPNEPFDGEILV